MYSSSQNNNSILITTSTCSPGPLPSKLDSPAAGWQYFLSYNTTSGIVNSLSVMPACQFANGEDYYSMFAGSDINVINVTSSQYLPELTVNGYLNAFYVRQGNQQLTKIPGITFSDNYSLAYYDGQQITNGTTIPLPWNG